MTEQEMGKDLRDHNDKIVQCITVLREQRDELNYLIEKQQEERKKTRDGNGEDHIQVVFGLEQKENYDKTLIEIEDKYDELVKNSGDLLLVVQKEFEELDSIINKKTSTDDTQMGDDEKIDSSFCSMRGKECKCEVNKEHKGRKQAKLKNIDIEEPIKLEKSDENVLTNESVDTKPENDHQEEVEEGTKGETKDQDSDEEREYSLHFRKYS
ncbi:hypothetical protein NQ318_001950 [Aromia moschata]|uniref:Uncharacterized protein n=1 Tax=Aromia moschata TaxID=1265417 RepID=A0AAV8Z1D8_9CUCU|nr:hypothetical protein NQ318_001950 [Aromia moschata]